MNIDSHVTYLKNLERHIRQSHEFKSLRYKTQVLNLGVEQPEQKLTNRMEHSEQVAKCSANLVQGAGGNPEEIQMAYVMGLSHDLGHVAFGHAGETALKDLTRRKGEPGFSHSDYGSQVFGRLVDEYCAKRVQEIEEYTPEKAVAIQKEIAYLQEKKGEMCEGIRNHGQYYAHSVTFYTSEEEKLEIEKLSPNATKENKIGNCVRLADTISFMCSDMHDLTMGRFDNKKSVVSMKDAEQFFQSLEGHSNFDMLPVKIFLENIKKGQDGVKEIQEEICKEVACESMEQGRLESISDEYKYTREIKHGLEGVMANPDKLKNYLPIYAVEGYDRLKQGIVGYRGLTEEEKEILGRCKKVKNSDTGDLQKGLQVIQDYYEQNGIEKQWETERKSLWARKPMLAVVFEIQDQKQYTEIIIPKKTVRFHNDIVKNKERMIEVFKKYKAEGEKMLQTGGKAANEVLSCIGVTQNPAENYAISKVHGLTNITLKEEALSDIIKQEKRAADKAEFGTNVVETGEYIEDGTQGLSTKGGIVSEAIDNVQGWTGNVANTVQEVTANAVATVQEWTVNAVDTVQEWTGEMVDNAGELFTKLAGKQERTVETVGVPMTDNYMSMSDWKVKISEKRRASESDSENTGKKKEHTTKPKRARGE